jgi:hypothetical protein
MLTGGHFAASYLLTQLPQNFGVILNNSEVISILIAGNLPDIDFIVDCLPKRVEKHTIKILRALP